MFRLCCLLCLSGLFINQPGNSQSIESIPQRNAAFSADTALFNTYINKADRQSLHNRDSMHYYLRQAYLLARKNHYASGLSQYYHFLTEDYNARSHYDSAMHTARQEMYWASRSGDSLRIAWAYNALANVYEYIGNMDSSAGYFIKALNIIDPVRHQRLAGTLNYNLASVLFSIGDYPRALHYAQKGYDIGTALQNVHMMSNSLLDMGCIHVGLQHYDTAIACFDRVIAMVKHTPDSITILDALNNKGDVYAKEKQFRQSLDVYMEMLKRAKQEMDPYYLLYAYGNLGITQLQMHRLQQAAVNLKKAIQMAKNQHARNELRQFYESYSEVKEAQNQFAAALTFRKKYDSLNDTLMNEAGKKNIHLLEVKYNTAQKDKQLAQQQLSLTQKQRSIERKNTWLFIFLGGLIALATILLLSIRSYRHKRKLHRQSLLTLQKQHELDRLKTEMHAREEERNRIGREMHDDIGSALTTILYLSDDLKVKSENDNQHTAERIASTAGSVVDKMNEIIWSMNEAYDTLDDLMAYTRQHAAEFLENYHLEYHFNMPDAVPDIHLQGEQRRNIYLVIKEALHNIVKHACATQVDLSFSITGKLVITIHDNGKGITPDKSGRFGNGLGNMRQRMKSVGGTFSVTNDNGTLITLKCPLEKEKI